MNLNLTGDILYTDFANSVDYRTQSIMVGDDGSKGEWVECDNAFDFYIDDWHIMRVNAAGDVFQSVPQTDRWRLADFLGNAEENEV